MLIKSLVLSKKSVVFCLIFVALGAYGKSAKKVAKSGPGFDWDKPAKLALKAGDGLIGGLDGDKVGAMLKIRQKMSEMLNGKKTKGGSLLRPYSFKGQLHSIATLAEYEEDLAKALQEAHELGDNEAVEKIAQEQKLLQECLTLVKQDFTQAVVPFLALARGVKGIIVLLIEDSCIKRKRKGSLLHDWAHLEGEDEMDSFNEKISSFGIFKQFCKDLYNFLGDIIKSCPKGFQQFLKLSEDWKAKKAH